MKQVHRVLTLRGELVLFASRSLGLEAGVTLVALGPDASVMEDTDGVELTATVNALHHAKGREGAREGECKVCPLRHSILPLLTVHSPHGHSSAP